MSQNGIGTPKNIWFKTSPDVFSLISYFDLWRSFISGDQDLHDHLRLKRSLRIELEHPKTCDLIPHMSDLLSLILHFDLWRSLIFGGYDLLNHLRLNRGLRIGTPKNLWFDTSHDLFTLISYFDLFRGRYWREVKMEVNALRSQIFFVIHVDDQNYRLHAKFQPSFSIFRLYAACTKFGVTKCQSAPPPPPSLWYIFSKGWKLE